VTRFRHGDLDRHSVRGTIKSPSNIIDASFQALIIYKLVKSGAPALPPSRHCGENKGGGLLMIDHISIAVRDLAKGERFYAAALAPLGLSKLREWPEYATIGFGKKYPEFWINKRTAMDRVADDSGVHICLRAPDPTTVDAFHAAALQAGGTSDGPPGPRPHYSQRYYAAFIRDPDGNRIEAVTFLRENVE
jgi:catechol 2,3-dioxygenase-like lactoylglutathione lyase family enzyme